MPLAEGQGPVIGTISVSTSVSLSAARRVTLPKRATQEGAGEQRRAADSRTGKPKGAVRTAITGSLLTGLFSEPLVEHSNMDARQVPGELDSMVGLGLSTPLAPRVGTGR
jgi:hypothetical protein